MESEADEIGEQVSAILSTAQDAANEMLRDAQAHAERIRTEAEQRADQIRTDAEQRARKLETEARRRRDGLAAEAEAVQENLQQLVDDLRTLDGRLSLLLNAEETTPSPSEAERTTEATEDVQALVAQPQRGEVERRDDVSEEP
jgi:cell division septum initiation protein DivIVA